MIGSDEFILAVDDDGLLSGTNRGDTSDGLKVVAQTLEETRERVRLPHQLADLELRVQDRPAIEGLAAVKELLQVQLNGLADAFALRAHSLRGVEREGVGRPHMGLPNP